MNEICFYDKERNLVMLFNNFRLGASMENPIFVYFDGKIDIDFFHVETDFMAEFFDFRCWRDSLQAIYENKRKIAQFNPLSSNLKILFESNGCGHIFVKCEVANDLYTCNFKFEYMIDQSFLPELIRTIESVIEKNINPFNLGVST